ALQEREAALSAKRWQLAQNGAPAATRAALERSLAETSAQLARRQPKPSSVAASDSVAALERVLARAPRDLSLVEFLSAPSGGYAWVASGGTVRIRRMSGEAEIASAVERARAILLGANRDADWAEPLESLCDVVFRPFAADVKGTRVALVLDGALQGVP